MPSTKPATKGEALSSSATAQKRAFIPSVVNPYSEFTQPQFDAFVSDITTKIRDVLHGGRKKDKGKGKDMSLFGGNMDTTCAEQGDAMGFEQFSFSNKVRNGLNGSIPLGADDVLTDEEEQEDGAEREEQGEVDGGVEEQILWPASDEEPEEPEPPQVIIQGAGGADDPIVIDLLDSDEEEPLQVNGKRDVDDHEESHDEEESDEGEDDNIPGQQWNNLLDSDEESDEERRLQVQESDQPNTGKVRTEEPVGDVLPASSPVPDDQDDEEDHNDDAELDHMRSAYQSFIANMNTSGSAMPYAEGPDLHTGTGGYSSEITETYYSLYSYDNTSPGYVDPLRSSSQASNRARQRATNEEGMSWTHPPAFPPRDNSVTGHGACQSEEPHHRVFPISSAGYAIPASVITSFTNAFTTDGYTPVDETQYHSVYRTENSVQRLPMGPAELTSGAPFDTVDIYADLAIDPSLDADKAVNVIFQSTSIEGIQSDMPTDEPVVEEPRDDVRGIANEALEVVEVVAEESVEIPAIEIDTTDVDPLALETTTYGAGALTSLLTPDLRPLMGLPSPTSPTTGLFPMQEKSQDPQVSEVDQVDSEQLLAPNGVIHPLQKLDGLEQAVSAMPLVGSQDASPALEGVRLKREFDTSEQALNVSDTDPAAQDTTVPPLISATSKSQVATLLETEPSAFTYNEESQLPSTLEETQTFGYADEKSECHSIRGSSILSGEFEQDGTGSPQRRQAKRGTSNNNGLTRELQRLQDGVGITVIDGPRLRRTTSSKSGGPPAANASVRGRRRGGAVSPRKRRAGTPIASMPPPSDVPKKNRVLRSNSGASSVTSDQSIQKPPSKSPSLDHRASPFEPRLDTTLGTEATSSAGSTPTKKRKRRPRISILGDEEDYVSDEIEDVHKKRRVDVHNAIEAESSLVGVDLGEALATLKAKRTVEDESSPRESIDASPSTLQASITAEGSAAVGGRQRSVTQSNDSYTDSDLTPLPSEDEGIRVRGASSPSKRARKRRLKPMGPQHTRRTPLTDSEEYESGAESATRRETAHRINMQNGYETEVEVPVQDTRQLTPVYEGNSHGSTTDSSDSDGSSYSGTVGSTEESTVIVGGAPEEPEVKVDGLEQEPKALHQKSRRMRRMRSDNLAYKPSPSSESEGDVEQLLEQEEMKERERRLRKAIRKARRTRKKKAALAGGIVVDANAPIESRKRKRPSEAVKENENRRGKKLQVEDLVGDSEPKKKRVKKDHHPAEMGEFTPVTNGVEKSDRALKVERVESDLKLAEPIKPLGQEDLTLVSHRSVVLDGPIFVANEKDKNEAGAWWLGRLFSKKST